MMLTLHIAIALLSLVLTARVWSSPSSKALRLSYSYIAGTLASGTLLVVSAGSHIVYACVMGLLFTAFSLYGALAGSRKLALESAER